MENLEKFYEKIKIISNLVKIIFKFNKKLIDLK